MTPHDEDKPSPALSAIVDEVRAARPEVDWEKLEARLFDERGDVRAPAPPPRRRVAMFGAFAVAAAFAIAMFSPSRAVNESAEIQEVAKVVRPPVTMGGAPVAIGTVIEGGVDGTWLRALGRISIRFEPGSRGVLLDDGERIRVALETGAVTADVTPVLGGEPFAVDVLGKRVAVHGTHLRVARLTTGAEVAVSEGNAVIGEPAGEGRTEGPLVLAGSIGTFASAAEPAHVTQDPQRATSLVEDALAMRPHVETVAKAEIPSIPPTVISPPAPVKVEAPPVVASAAPATAVTDVAPPAPPPNGLTAEQLAGPFAKIDGDLKKCAIAGGKVQFSTDVTLHISLTGKIDDFTVSAIPPEHRDCVRGVLFGAIFPTAASTTTVTKKIDLSPK